MNEYHVFVWMGHARTQFGIRLRARNKGHAMLLAGLAFGNKFRPCWC